mgnify:CR=1 FL=1
MTQRILAEQIATKATSDTPVPTDVRAMLHRVTLDAFGLMLAARQTDYIEALKASCLDQASLCMSIPQLIRFILLDNTSSSNGYISRCS